MIDMSDESGQYEVYVRPFPSLDGKWQISADGGQEPVWPRSGKELFYRKGAQNERPINVRLEDAPSPCLRANRP